MGGTYRTGGAGQNYGHGLKYIEGSFTVTSSNIVSSRTKRGGFTLKRANAGVYTVTIDFGALEVVNSWVQVGPNANSSGAVPATQNVVAPPATITSDFIGVTSNGVNYAADNTNRVLTIFTYNAGGSALADVANTSRVCFEVCLATSNLDK